MALVSALTDKLTNGNGKHHSDSDMLNLADPGLMRVVKREGNIVPYDRNKILRAVGMCFESVAERIGGITPDIVTDQVDTILRLKSRQLSEDGNLAEIGIEAIQDIVEAQLMALGQFEAAKHYILYRDERRRVREESRGISPEMRDFFKAGCATFTGTNRLLQEVQAFDKFSRFRRDFTPKRREIWPETCQRVMDYYCAHVKTVAPGAIPEELWTQLHNNLFHQKATGSLRGVQMAGPALDRCQSGVYNCSFLFMDSPESMAEDLYLLMQGCGVGFSVEEEHAVDKWPRVHGKRDCAPVNYTVEDDTEAWCDALKFGINHWMDGVDVKFDLSPIRPAGSILKTKGGRASGPRPLKDLLEFDRDVIFRRQKQRLRSIDLHDMTCMLHHIGQMGGVRRASGISFSDKDDLLMRDAKKGEFFKTHPWRTQANNSAVYAVKPSAIEFMEEWLALAKSGSGERGIFNEESLRQQIPVRRLLTMLRGNPCVTADGWIHTGEGPKMVRDLIGMPFTAVVDGRFFESEGFFKTGHHPILRIKFSNGMSIRVTSNHQILSVTHQTEKKQYFEWMEAGSLSVGSRVALHNHRAIEWDGSGTFMEGWLLGSLIGDGNIEEDGKANLDFWGDTQEEMLDLAARRIHVAVGAREDCWGCQDEYRDRSRISSVNLGTLAKSYGMQNQSKMVGKEIEEASADFYRGFLRGWFDADGSVQGLTINSISVRLSSIVLSNLYAAQRMLARLGIISTIYENRLEERMQLMPDGKGGKKEYHCQAMHELSISCDNIQEFEDRVGFDDPEKKELLEYAISSYRRTPNRERFVTCVAEIINEEPEDVYDCRVPGADAFDLNGIYVHNCMEIYLRNHEFCNLSIAVVDVNDSFEVILRKVILATIWGTIQASMKRFRYLRPDWKQNCEEEALLGVDILGHMDCKLLKPGAPGREEILQKLLQAVIETNVYWARRLGINPGAALTCGKPSGDSSVFFDKAAGLKAHHGKFYIRRLRFEETNPVTKVLRDAKVPWQYNYDQSGVCVFEFPCRAPDDAIILGDMTAVEQLENWKTWKVNFTEHNPSVTISVKDHEWIEAGHWVYQNWDIVGGISFYPFDNAIYPLAPYQTITEQEYVQRDKVMPTEIDWSRILLYEEEDETTLSAQIACTGPGCDL